MKGEKIMLTLGYLSSDLSITLDDRKTVCKDNFGGQLLGAVPGFTEVLLRSQSLTRTEDLKLV